MLGMCLHVNPPLISTKSTFNCRRTLRISALIAGTDLPEVVETLNKPLRKTGFAKSELSNRSVETPLASCSMSVSSGTLAS